MIKSYHCDIVTLKSNIHHHRPPDWPDDSEQFREPSQADPSVQSSAQSGQPEYHGTAPRPQLQERIHFPQGPPAKGREHQVIRKGAGKERICGGQWYTSYPANNVNMNHKAKVVCVTSKGKPQFVLSVAETACAIGGCLPATICLRQACLLYQFHNVS